MTHEEAEQLVFNQAMVIATLMMPKDYVMSDEEARILTGNCVQVARALLNLPLKLPEAPT